MEVDDEALSAGQPAAVELLASGGEEIQEDSPIEAARLTHTTDEMVDLATLMTVCYTRALRWVGLDEIIERYANELDNAARACPVPAVAETMRRTSRALMAQEPTLWDRRKHPR